MILSLVTPGHPPTPFTDGARLTPAANVRADGTNGPVTWLLLNGDGSERLRRDESAAPLFAFGDINGVGVPNNLPPGRFTLIAVDWGEGVKGKAAVTRVGFEVVGAVVTPTPTPPVPTPTPVPVPTPVPPVTTLRRIVANPQAKPRGAGVRSTGGGPFALSGVHVDGWSQNIVVMHTAGARLENVRSVGAWRDQGKLYHGNGAYTEGTGRLIIRGCIFADNGWQPGRPLGMRGQFAHGIYTSYGVSLDMEDCIFLRNSGCGFQARGIGGMARRCVKIDNGIGFANAMGNLVMEDSLILGGRYYANTDGDGKLKSWTGMNGAWLNWPTVLRNVTFAALAGQYDGDAAVRQTNVPRFTGAAIVASTIPKKTLDAPGHEGWKASPTTSLIDAKGVIVAGWRNAVGGDLEGKQNLAGIDVRPAAVQYDYDEVVRQALEEKITVQAAVERIRSEVARLIG